MNALAERLRAAAERLTELDKAASESPWEITEEHGCDFSGEGYSYITLSMRDTDGDVARWYGETTREAADAALIVTLRPLAPVIASLLRQHAVMAADVVPSEAGRRWHITERCGYSLDPTEGQVGCDCFTDALALADAILGEAS